MRASPPGHGPTRAPGPDVIAALAEAVLAGLPKRFRAKLSPILFRVEEFPDQETMEEMGLESPFDLLGLYRGVPLDHASVLSPRAEPDMIFLYRRPILDQWIESGVSLEAVVRHVLIHEIGHHWGLSDAAMAAIERED